MKTASRQQNPEIDSLEKYYQEIHSFPILSHEEELGFAKRFFHNKNDIEARDALINHNLRFVLWVAGKFDWSTLSRKDRIQDGNIGLMAAIENFEYWRGHRLITYAKRLIFSNIQREMMNTEKTIRTPVHLQELRNKIKRVEKKLAQQFERRPTIKELCEEISITEDVVLEVFSKIYEEALSLDRMLNDEDEDSSLASVLADTSAATPEFFVEVCQELSLSHQRIAELVSALKMEQKIKAPHKEIFLMRYGLDDGSRKKHRKTDVAKEFHCSSWNISVVNRRIWRIMQKRGVDMNEEKLLEEFWRIEELKKLVETYKPDIS